MKRKRPSARFRKGMTYDGTLLNDGTFRIDQITTPDGTVYGRYTAPPNLPKVVIIDSQDDSIGPGIIVKKKDQP